MTKAEKEAILDALSVGEFVFDESAPTAFCAFCGGVSYHRVGCQWLLAYNTAKGIETDD